MFPKGVDKLIAKKIFILFFCFLKKKIKKIMMWLLSRVRVDGCGHDGLGGNMWIVQTEIRHIQNDEPLVA